MGGRSWGRRSRTSRRSRMGEVAGARVIYPRRSWSPPQLVSGLNCGHCPPFYNQPSKLYNCCQITQNICCPEITMRHQAFKCFFPFCQKSPVGFFLLSVNQPSSGLDSGSAYAPVIVSGVTVPQYGVEGKHAVLYCR